MTSNPQHDQNKYSGNQKWNCLYFQGLLAECYFGVWEIKRGKYAERWRDEVCCDNSKEEASVFYLITKRDHLQSKFEHNHDE